MSAVNKATQIGRLAIDNCRIYLRDCARSHFEIRPLFTSRLLHDAKKIYKDMIDVVFTAMNLPGVAVRLVGLLAVLFIRENAEWRV